MVTKITPSEPQRLLWVTGEDASQTLHGPSFGPVTPNLESPEKLEYSGADGTKADVEIFHAPTEPAPTVGVVYSPWKSVPGFPLAQTRGLEYFVRQGYTVALAATPSERLNEAVKDDQIAFGTWLCDRTWVDGDRVALFGTSAGGHDVANLLLTRETPRGKRASCTTEFLISSHLKSMSLRIQNLQNTLAIRTKIPRRGSPNPPSSTSSPGSTRRFVFITALTIHGYRSSRCGRFETA